MQNDTTPILAGKVYVLGDDIDTDQIIPARHLNLVPTIPAEYRQLGALALSGLPAEYPAFIKPGKKRADYKIVIAGRNFGCGSSREHAPIALAASGIQAIVAESYARIFFRNAVATGALFPFEAETNLRTVFQTGDEAEIQLEREKLRHSKSGQVFKLKSLGAVRPVVAAGGLFAYARKMGMINH
ncbi:MAG: 3-isopropylmalate dehydratase [Lentisphaerae bacterium]|nr:3-isopropylmalate dehydratase [Lentisphaerota bacterium]